MIRSKLSNDINKNKINVEAAFCFSGGGTTASTFSLGAIKRYAECGLINIKTPTVFSSSSGSVFTQHLIELISLHYDMSDSKWVDIYLRPTIYKYYGLKFYFRLIVRLLLVPFWLFNVNKFIDLNIVEFNLLFPKFYNLGYKKPPGYNFYFSYNYVNTSLERFTDDNSDVVTEQLPITSNDWIWRIIRATFPLAYHNKIGSLDGGASDNSGITTVIDSYNPKKIFITTLTADYPKEKTVTSGAFGLIINLANIFFSANVAVLRTYTSLFKINNLQIIIARLTDYKFNMSKHKLNGDMNNFIDNQNYIGSFLNGLFYLDERMLKIIENEGYLQANESLERNNIIKKTPLSKLLLKMPNPEYSDPKQIDEIKKDFSKKASISILVKSFVTVFFEELPTVYWIFLIKPLFEYFVNIFRSKK